MPGLVNLVKIIIILLATACQYSFFKGSFFVICEIPCDNSRNV